MTVPTPAMIKKQLSVKKQNAATPQEESVAMVSSGVEKVPVPTSHETSEITESKPQKISGTNSTSSDGTKKPYKRPEHLTQKPLSGNEDLQKLQGELKEMESINRSVGWYDRNKNGKQSKSLSARAELIAKTAQTLKNEVDSGKLVDIGKGSEVELGVTQTVKMLAVKQLKDEGYRQFYIPIRQKLEDDRTLTVVVLASPDSTWNSVFQRRGEWSKIPARFLTSTPSARDGLLQEKTKRAAELKDSGMSNVAIGKSMGIPESSVRSLLARANKEKN